MDDWFVSFNGQTFGPLNLSAARTAIAHREEAAIYVWRQGFNEWQLVSETPEFGASETILPNLRPDADLRIAPVAPETDEEEQLVKSRWAKRGAVVGIALAILDAYFLSSRGEYSIEFLIGTILGGAFAGGVIGFFIAVCIVASRRVDQKKEGENRNHRFNNFIAKHWRGDFSLPFAYWGIGIIGNIVGVMVPIFAISALKSDTGYFPPAIFAAVAVTWVSSSLITLWMTVGVWRSAKHYSQERIAENRSAAWGLLARVAVVLSILSFIGTMNSQALPQLSETYRMAFKDDPDIPPFSIRVMRDGTEVEIVGGFKYGLTADFEKVLNASQRIKVVHLTSPGGRLGEGEKLFNLLRSKGLSTYVSHECMSACSVAFAGGKERFLLSGAKIGFHRGSFPGSRERSFDDAQARIFRKVGIKENFIARALSTPHKEMWKPSADLLLASGVITSVTDGSKFAYSGIGKIDKERLARDFADAAPVFNEMNRRFPKQYASLIEDYQEAILSGKSETETTNILKEKFHTFMRRIRPLAEDAVLHDYSKLLADQYLELGKKDVASCRRYAALGGAPDLPENLKSRENDLQLRIVMTAKSKERVSENLADKVWAKLGKNLMAAGVGEDELEMLSTKEFRTVDPRRYCNISILFMREITRLPTSEAAIIMRKIFEQ